jgi:hypothetical protein
LGPGYVVAESEDCLLLLPQPGPPPAALLQLAEKCRHTLLAILPGVADFRFAGPQIVIVLGNQDDYYRYLSFYYPEGHHGGSAGVHVREGYPHIALAGINLALLENTLAHEMTHASLCHLKLPQWIEEGLAQMSEHDITGRAVLQLNEEMARRHKHYWAKHGLDNFWRGEGFSRPGKIQVLCYQLAEILIRLLIEEYRPRWFGWDTGQQRRLFAFLQDANVDDCGDDAAQAHLGLSLQQIASWFLGPGDWNPRL